LAYTGELSVLIPPLCLDLKQGIRNCVKSKIQPGSHKEITIHNFSEGAVYISEGTYHFVMLFVLLESSDDV